MSRSLRAGSGFLVEPELRPAARGVLVLHSWWGLTPFFKETCRRLAAHGYVALAPDLLAGALPATPDEAEAVLKEADVNVGANLVLASAGTLRSLTADPAAPVGVIGYSMGASWGLWLSARRPAEVAAAVAFYGTQNIDFDASQAAYLGHFAEYDALVSDDEVNELEAHLHLVGKDVTFHRYPDTSHWFCEEDQQLAFQPEAAALAWRRTIEFLDAALEHEPPAEPNA